MEQPEFTEQSEPRRSRRVLMSWSLKKGGFCQRLGFTLLFGDIVIMWSFAVVRLPRTEEELDATTEKRGLLMVWDWELEC